MRTTARPPTGTATAPALVALGTVVALGAPAAYAGDFEALEVHPSSAAPGTTVTVSTTACGPEDGRGAGDARSLGAGEFELVPGTHEEIVVGRFTLPAHARPGTYAIGVACDNGRSATGDLVVGQGGGTDGHQQPSGHVATGVGGSAGPDTTRIAAGAAVLVASAAGGAWFLRRRASGAQGG
ncbi:hypothetical protein ACLGI4_20255 [Streptomyces sp. HMX112]|uniref:hypothetical protein n=1 Tax=Streptomyces sp. HMX112 TaxID=3390850 RepID=UPI003A7FBD2C